MKGGVRSEGIQAEGIAGAKAEGLVCLGNNGKPVEWSEERNSKSSGGREHRAGRVLQAVISGFPSTVRTHPGILNTGII